MTADGQRGLSPDEMARALECVRTWRAGSRALVSCPRCAEPGIVIEDRSARPHAEWYALSCRSCGFSHNLHIPLSPPAFGSD